MPQPKLPDPRVVVGLDFGTTFSGYGYAHKASPTEGRTFYEWPGQAAAGARPYCKTKTAVYYERSASAGEGGWELKSWGWQAQVDYTKKYGKGEGKNWNADQANSGVLLTRFKLHLANKFAGQSTADPLPKGLTVNRVVTDFLRGIGDLIMEQLRDQYGKHFNMEGVQWCVTVPTIWDENAKRQMKECMKQAGLTGGQGKSSPYPLIIILEPEAASLYCYEQAKGLELKKGDQFLVADIGGGTADLVVQEKATDSKILQVVEVSHSTGGLCGGTHIDSSFLAFLSKKIGCLNTFLNKNGSVKHALLGVWEQAKATFDGNPSETIDIWLPSSLAMAWEDFEADTGNVTTDINEEIELTCAQMEEIFAPTVDRILLLIAAQLSQSPGIKVLMVVGGFSGSPYLMKRIKERFSNQVGQIVRPLNPGSSVCQGAVALGFNKNTVLSRVARKTYGIGMSAKFEKGTDPEEDRFVTSEGVAYCRSRFLVFASEGSKIEVDQEVTHLMSNLEPGGTSMVFKLYSSPKKNPRYTKEKGVVKECPTLTVDLGTDFDQKERAKANVTMYFGRTSVEVKAVGLNFGDGSAHEMEPTWVQTEWVN